MFRIWFRRNSCREFWDRHFVSRASDLFVPYLTVSRVDCWIVYSSFTRVDCCCCVILGLHYIWLVDWVLVSQTQAKASRQTLQSKLIALTRSQFVTVPFLVTGWLLYCLPSFFIPNLHPSSAIIPLHSNMNSPGISANKGEETRIISNQISITAIIPSIQTRQKPS